MPGIAVQTDDFAGGMQLAGGQSKFKIKGRAAVVLGDKVTPHGPPPHSPLPAMVQATANFRVAGIPVCRQGHAASCGHATTGRSFFKIP